MSAVFEPLPCRYDCNDDYDTAVSSGTQECEVYLQWTSSFELMSNIKDNTPALVTHSKLPRQSTCGVLTMTDFRFSEAPNSLAMNL
ncbi:hypothetical protein TNCV_278231 [Trichonephila clavipes]|nr:hypothetical protein TNCV_278231 [Trichonephila clavipes]